MFNLNSSLPNQSAAWDTNYARNYLLISEEQLEKINKIPGWSKTEISAIENDKNLENIEKQLDQLASAENILTSSTYISVKDNDNLKNQNCNSNVQSKQNPASPLNEKELFLKNISLISLRKEHTPVYSLQRSSSLPDLREKFQLAEVPSYSKSEESCRKQIHSTEKDLSCCKLAPVLAKVSNKTHTISGVDDSLNYNKLSKQKFQTLDDSILNSKCLKNTETSVITYDTVPLSSNRTVQAALKQKMSLFEKKFLLLEKRLSPCKEMSPPPFNSKLRNLENLNCEKKSSQSSTLADKVVTTAANSDSVENLLDEEENSAISKSCQSLEFQANSHSINEKSGTLENAFQSDKDIIGDASKPTVCNFDSFLSPPLPCGQRIPTEVLSLSQPIPSQKSAELSTPNKLQNTNPQVPCEQLTPIEIPSQSQLIPSQKSAELSTPNKLQNVNPQVPCKRLTPTEIASQSQPMLSHKLAELSASSKSLNAELAGKVIEPENPRGKYCVFSVNLKEKGSDLASGKESGTKRKRKIKSEKSSKKLDAKKIKRTDIQFSSAQIRNMLEIMKLFHAEF